MDAFILGGLGVLIVLVAVLALLLLQKLNATRSSVEGAKDVMSDRALETMQQIREFDQTMHGLIQQQEEAQRLGQSLKDLLQGPRLRGSYGEVVLEEMLERVLPRGIWERQYTIDGGERVDCAVKFKDVTIPIDAKFPRDDYMRYMEAESPDERAIHWKAFEEAVKRQIADIQRKYVKPERGTSDFALMFIPSEAIYYETIAEKNYLGQPSSIQGYSQEHRVIPVSPNTFYAFLQVILLALHNVEIIRTAEKIRQGLAELQRSFDYFYARYGDMGRALDRAAEAYRVGDGHIERYKRRLDSTLSLEGFEDGPVPQLPNSEREEG